MISEADVAHVQAAFDEFNKRFEDLRTLEGLRAYHQDFFTPDMVIDNVESFPTPTRYEGFEGYQLWFADTLAPYEGMHWRVESHTPIGERVLTTASIAGRQPGDPTLLEVRLFLLYSLQDGQISRIEVFLSQEAAEAVARASA